MCGIAGFVGRDAFADDRAHGIRKMCAAIRHRGPDDEGFYIDQDVAIGMRRLSIIDVAGGHQPIANEDGSIHVVFNGEIYNHRELREQLLRAGHRFTTSSDTEVLVHLYEDHGDSFVSALRGMFAFAIWDARRRHLLIGRDRVGIKPLYYAAHLRGLAFGSELRALLALESTDRRVDPTAVGWYLSLGYVPDPLSILGGVRKLPPAHVLTWDAETGARIVRYWTPVRQETPIDEVEATRELQRLLSDAVRSHLESEVPLGAFLSGGIDSSLVVAEMARHVTGPVHTFSIGFDEPDYNEAPHAASVARALGTRHTELILRPDADALIDSLICALDEPFADSSALPTFLVSRLAREQVTVALSGDGGDELFGGYTRYTNQLARREPLPEALRRALRAGARRLPHGTVGRNQLLDLACTRKGRYAYSVAAPLREDDGGVALDSVAHRIPQMDGLLEPWFRELEGRDFATQMMLLDVVTYLPGDILTKVDRMSMAVSLEARVPLLDHPVVEFAMSLPSSMKIRSGTTKWLLRKVAAGVLPASILRKPKQGFALPVDRWLRAELRYRVSALCAENARILEFVDMRSVQRVAAEHIRGRREHGWTLWKLLVLEGWLSALASGELDRPAESPPFAEITERGHATRATTSATVNNFFSRSASQTLGA